MNSTQIRTIAEALPKTFELFQKELEETKERLATLQQVALFFEQEDRRISEEQWPEVEVVIPEQAPDHKQGKAFGPKFAECLIAARVDAGRSGPVATFINLKDGTSIAVHPEDFFPETVFSTSPLEDRSPRTRVVWTKTERGSSWLI